MCSIVTLKFALVDCVPLVSASISCEQWPYQVMQEQNLSVCVNSTKYIRPSLVPSNLSAGYFYKLLQGLFSISLLSGGQ